MKKEKQIKAHTRRTKSGKTVAVKAHTAKYDAADMAKEALKKKGAGAEFVARKSPFGNKAAKNLNRLIEERKDEHFSTAEARKKYGYVIDHNIDGSMKVTYDKRPVKGEAEIMKKNSTSKKKPIGAGSTGRTKKK